MIKRISLVISWACISTIVLISAVSLYLLYNIDSFLNVAKGSIGLPIHWHTITSWQLYMLWSLTALYVSIGLIGLYFLRRAFANFANGELFNLANSRDIRLFSILLLTQSLAKPLLFTLSSLLLSLYHPAGEKIFAIAFGSNEIITIVLAMIMWVVSALLVEGSKLQVENRQFV